MVTARHHEPADPAVCARCQFMLTEQPDGAYRLYRMRGGVAICVVCAPLAFGEEATSNLRRPSPMRGRAGTNIEVYVSVRVVADGVLRFEAE